jgi:hypothetical protein
VTLSATAGRQIIRLLFEQPGNDYTLIVRNVDGTRRPSCGTIFGATLRDGTEYPAADIKVCVHDATPTGTTLSAGVMESQSKRRSPPLWRFMKLITIS